MALRKNMLKGGLAALMMMVMTVGAYAWTASATASVNVRSGPGTNFRVVDVLQRGEQVFVEYCRGSWCFIDQGRFGPNGWVSANYLAQAAQPRPPQWNPAPPPPHWNPNPPRPPHWNPNPPRPPHWNPNPPRPPHWNPNPPRPPHWNPNPRPPYNPGNSQVCFNGPNGYFCMGN